MKSSLVAEYIKLVLEQQNDSARVPQQLISPEDAEESKSHPGDESEACGGRLGEFSGCAAVAGYTAPLGASQVSLKKKMKRR